MARSDSSYQMSVAFVTVFTHLLVIAFATLVLVWLVKFPHGFAFISIIKTKIFKMHPLLMILEFVIFTIEATVVYKAIPSQTQKLVYLILHVITLVIGTRHVYAAFKFHPVIKDPENPTWISNIITNLIDLPVGPCHHELRFPHNYTLHSWIGLTTICLFTSKWLLAFFCFRYLGVESTIRAMIAPWHVFFGIGIFFMTITTAETRLAMKFHFLNLQRSKEELSMLIADCIGMLISLLGISIGLTIILPWII